MSGTGTCRIEISSLKLTDESENCGASHGYNQIMGRLVNDEHFRYDVETPGSCFTNVSRAPRYIIAKIHNTRNHIYGENLNLKICTCAQSKALGTRAKFQLESLITSTICAIHKFRDNFWRARETLVKQPPGYRNAWWIKAWWYQRLG